MMSHGESTIDFKALLFFFFVVLLMCLVCLCLPPDQCVWSLSTTQDLRILLSYEHLPVSQLRLQRAPHSLPASSEIYCNGKRFGTG